MSQSAAAPFSRFSFTLVEDRMPRRALSLKCREDDLFELHVEKGSASNPSMQFTRTVPQEVAERLRDGLQEAGVFSWEEVYGDESAPGSLRWTVSVVFKEGVFALSSRGGSDVPEGFDLMLEQLYRLDFPRPAASEARGAERVVSQADYSQIADMMKEAGLDGLDSAELRRLLGEAQANPQALQQRMRDEFNHMPHEEQERMLDALASAGFASRAWWERFLRGL